MHVAEQRKRTALATRRVLEALDAPVDAELLRYSADVQLADAVALVAERVVELGRRVEVLEAAKKPRPKPKPKTVAEE